jgi:uncharacterized membrane protein YedE/YeeE
MGDQNESGRTYLDPRAFGLACGLLWAGGVAFIAVIARFGWAERLESLISDAYIGYGESERGIAIGAVWAFFDAAIGGYTFAWLYDRLVRS